jgi:hypothetical protein
VPAWPVTIANTTAEIIFALEKCKIYYMKRLEKCIIFVDIPLEKCKI